MQDALSGNTKTTILANTTPTNTSYEDTVQALEFLNRMNGICNHPKLNKLDDLRKLNEMATEIWKLIMNIEANRRKFGHFLTDEMYIKH